MCAGTEPSLACMAVFVSICTSVCVYVCASVCVFYCWSQLPSLVDIFPLHCNEQSRQMKILRPRQPRGPPTAARLVQVCSAGKGKTGRVKKTANRIRKK